VEVAAGFAEGLGDEEQQHYDGLYESLRLMAEVESKRGID
jgi:hypothetical protein